MAKTKLQIENEIKSTLTGRNPGQPITPQTHQAFALDMLDYSEGVLLTTTAQINTINNTITNMQTDISNVNNVLGDLSTVVGGSDLLTYLTNNFVTNEEIKNLGTNDELKDALSSYFVSHTYLHSQLNTENSSIYKDIANVIYSYTGISEGGEGAMDFSKITTSDIENSVIGTYVSNAVSSAITDAKKSMFGTSDTSKQNVMTYVTTQIYGTSEQIAASAIGNYITNAFNNAINTYMNANIASASEVSNLLV